MTQKKVDVTNVVEGDGRRFTIRCTANWPDSNCSTLPAGDEFEAEIDGKTMWIMARKDGNQGKLVRMKNQILDIRSASDRVTDQNGRKPATEADIVEALVTAATKHPDLKAYEAQMNALMQMFKAGNVSIDDYIEGIYTMAKFGHFALPAPPPAP